MNSEQSECASRKRLDVCYLRLNISHMRRTRSVGAKDDVLLVCIHCMGFNCFINFTCRVYLQVCSVLYTCTRAKKIFYPFLQCRLNRQMAEAPNAYAVINV